MQRFTGLLGIAAILAVAWLLSKHKRAIKLRILLWGLGLQFGFAVLVLKTSFGKVFQAASVAVAAIGCGTPQGLDSVTISPSSTFRLTSRSA